MMMLSQCATFGTVSKAFWMHWEMDTPLTGDAVGKSPPTVSHCDWRETHDMLDFQAFAGSIEVKDDLPDIVATGIPLSVLFVAHHNLVTYGVPFVNGDGQWTNPGPTKTFYTPKAAITALAARLEIMSDNDGVVSNWLLNSNPKLDVMKGPGFTEWAEMAKEKWSEPWTMEAQQAWQMFHEIDSDQDTSS